MARILIADDNEADRLALHAFLERTGHEIVEAQHGEGALREYLRARMRAHPIQVVITDLQMPGVHGLHLIMLLRDLSPRPAIVAISGTGGDQLEMAHAIGADAMLTKPVDPTELLDAVDRALARAPDYEPADAATHRSPIELDPEPVTVEEAAPETVREDPDLGAIELEPESVVTEEAESVVAEEAESVVTEEPEREAIPEAVELSALESDPEPLVASEDTEPLAPEEAEPEPTHEAIDLGALELEPEFVVAEEAESVVAEEAEREAIPEAVELSALESDPEPLVAPEDTEPLAPEEAEPEPAHEAIDLGALLLGPEPAASDQDIELPTLDLEPEPVTLHEPEPEAPEHQDIELPTLDLEPEPATPHEPEPEASEHEDIELPTLDLEPEPVTPHEPEPEASEHQDIEPPTLDLEPEPATPHGPEPEVAHDAVHASPPLLDPEPRVVEEDRVAPVSDGEATEGVEEEATHVVARILIVDDNEEDRLILTAILEGAGHETFTAEDGRRALWVYGGKVIDVVITDLQMPRVHGLDLIKVLKDLSPRPKIIAISGVGADELHRAESLGADVTLSKPIDAGELLDAVRTVVASGVRTDPVIIDSFREQGS